MKRNLISLSFALLLTAGLSLPAAAQEIADTTVATDTTTVGDTAEAVDSAGTEVMIETSDSVSVEDDISAPDSLAPESSTEENPDSAAPALTPAARATPRARPGDRNEFLVIPWDWDQYTNVIEVGLRNLRDGTEYSLTRNELYDSLFIRYRDKVVRVRGQAVRDEDGFYNMTVNAILPPDTSATSPGGSSQP